MAKFYDCDIYAILQGSIEENLNPETEDEVEMIKKTFSWLVNESLLDYDVVKEYVFDNFDWDEKEE